MKISRRTNLIVLMIAAVMLSSACNNENDGQAQKGPETKEIAYTKDPEIISKVKGVEGVDDVRMVRSKDNLLVAIKVTNFDRFQLQQINKKVKKKLKKQNPDKKITVTPDKKIFVEIGQLKERIQKENLDQEAIHKKVKQLIKLSKEKG